MNSKHSGTTQKQYTIRNYHMEHIVRRAAATDVKSDRI